MKRSELTLTGETFRLTPDKWGDTSIMVDEDAVSESMAEAFGLESCDPDEDADELDSVEIATDSNGNHYAILVPFTRGRRVYNENMYRRCENPVNATLGSATLYGLAWDQFEDEE